MASVNKKIRKEAQKKAQAMRSERNKMRRVLRAKKVTPKGSKNASHQVNRLRRRLRVLNAKFKRVDPERQKQFTKRIDELNKLVGI